MGLLTLSRTIAGPTPVSKEGTLTEAKEGGGHRQRSAHEAARAGRRTGNRSIHNTKATTSTCDATVDVPQHLECERTPRTSTNDAVGLQAVCPLKPLDRFRRSRTEDSIRRKTTKVPL